MNTTEQEARLLRALSWAMAALDPDVFDGECECPEDDDEYDDHGPCARCEIRDIACEVIEDALHGGPVIGPDVHLLLRSMERLIGEYESAVDVLGWPEAKSDNRPLCQARSVLAKFNAPTGGD